MTEQAMEQDDRDMLYAPLPARPECSLHPSRMTMGRCVAAVLEATRPQYALTSFGGRLRRLTGRSHCVFTGSGRAALRLALERLGARPGTEVVLSTFNCPAVADAVLATGATPVLVDIDPLTGPDFASVDLRGRPVILTNGLGLDEWSGHARRVLDLGGMPVLDLAQAMPAPGVLARYAETEWPLVLSFGEGKPLGGVGGGALLYSPDRKHGPAHKHDPDLRGDADLRDRVPATPRSRREGWPRAERGSLAPLGRALRERALLYAPGFVRAAAVLRQRRSPEWSHTKAAHVASVAGSVEATGPTRWELGVATALFGTVEHSHAAATAHHAQVLSALGDRLATCRIVPSVPDLTSGIELLFHHRGDRQVFARALARHGVPSTWNYYPLHRITPYARYARDAMPGAEYLWRRVLTVPKQRQPRLSGYSLATAMLAADHQVPRTDRERNRATAKGGNRA